MRTNWSLEGTTCVMDTFLTHLIASHRWWCLQDSLLCDLGRTAVQEILSNAIYLENEIWESPEGYTVFGSPYSLSNSSTSPNTAFQHIRGSPAARRMVEAIPHCDVLVTHGPCLGHGDDPAHGMHGCAHLADRIAAVNPRLHVCGHVHQSGGVTMAGSTVFINAAVVDIFCCPRRPIITYTSSLLLKTD